MKWRFKKATRKRASPKHNTTQNGYHRSSSRISNHFRFTKSAYDNKIKMTNWNCSIFSFVRNYFWQFDIKSIIFGNTHLFGSIKVIKHIMINVHYCKQKKEKKKAKLNQKVNRSDSIKETK